MAKEKRMVKIFTSKDEKPIKVGNKPTRNSICTCGSGKKYKNCHWVEHEKKLLQWK